MNFKKKKRYLLLICVVVLITILVSGLSSIVTANDYDGHWAENSINNLRKMNILSGDDEGNFNPNNYMRRSEFVKVINRTFGFSEESETNFPDINENEWYANEFKIAKKAGYIKGDDLGNSNPNSNITRVEVSVILDRVITRDQSGVVEEFSDDIEIQDWAKSSVYRLAQLGIINGYEDNTFKPTN